jgi:hypothetical protein
VKRDTMTGHCCGCAHFRNSPAYLESVFPGMTAMSSAWGSTRAEDGICLKHDCYLSADAGCRHFTPLPAPAPDPAEPAGAAVA